MNEHSEEDHLSALSFEPHRPRSTAKGAEANAKWDELYFPITV
jgi:hypothetical protein